MRLRHYEVFILSRMREEYDRTGSTETAVIHGIGRTGRLVTSAALILFLAFVALASAPGSELKMVATGLAVGILLDATVIRALVVPAVIALMGRWNWWLPPGRRGCCACHPRFRRNPPVAKARLDPLVCRKATEASDLRSALGVEAGELVQVLMDRRSHGRTGNVARLPIASIAGKYLQIGA